MRTGAPRIPVTAGELPARPARVSVQGRRTGRRTEHVGGDHGAAGWTARTPWAARRARRLLRRVRKLFT